MPRDRFRRKISQLFDEAGIAINGDRPWDIRVHDGCFFQRLLAHGSLGLGDSYMDRWWDCDRLDEFFSRLFGARLETKVACLTDLIEQARAKVCNLQSRARAFEVGQRHYDIGNDLYERMLDRRMVYSCGFWQNAENLEQAQEHKLDLICRKLHMEPGTRLADIGCGWGGAARFAANRYGATVTGVTVSTEQADYGRKACAGLPVEIRLQDYRELNESKRFDRILSIGMFEHVGHKNYRTFMKTVRRNLSDDGLFVLHTIGGNRTVPRIDSWIHRHIFPNAMLPSPAQIGEAIDGLFVIEDWQNIGVDYDRTLLAWYDNFNRNWAEISDRYGERFYRMWKYYLLSCAASFRARKNQVWQLVLSPQGVAGGYQAPHHHIRLRSHTEEEAPEGASVHHCAEPETANP